MYSEDDHDVFENYKIIKQENGDWIIENPVDSNENLADAWKSQPDKSKMFFKWIKQLQNDFIGSVNESDEKIEFEIVFYNEFLFQYGFSIQKGVILNEWLEVDEALVFNREKTNLKYGSMYEDQLREFSKYREDRLYIGVLDYFISEDPLKKIIKSFRSFFINQLNLYSELIIESTIKGLNIGLRYSNPLIEDDEFRKKVVTYVQKVDLGIDDIIIEEEMIKTSDTNEMKKIPVLKTVHNIYDEKNKVVDTKKFELSYESSGTLRFLSFIQQVLEIIEAGGVFIVDELSSRLHPILTKFIVELFTSSDNKKGQLVFVTHDVSLMNKDQFRRDEIGLVDKNEKGESKFYTLYDLEVRKDASYDKDYFRGKYGAIPIVDSYNIFNEEC